VHCSIKGSIVAAEAELDKKVAHRLLPYVQSEVSARQ
jgi:hypothetical protein